MSHVWVPTTPGVQAGRAWAPWGSTALNHHWFNLISDNFLGTLDQHMKDTAKLGSASVRVLVQTGSLQGPSTWPSCGAAIRHPTLPPAA